MHKLREQFKAESKAADAPCWLCDGDVAIDYDAPFDDYANDLRFQLDHFFPVSEYPELQEVYEHFRASHAGCNRDRSNGAPNLDLGIPSREWT